MLSITSATAKADGGVTGTFVTTGDVTGIAGSATYSCAIGSMGGAAAVTESNFTASPMSVLPAGTCTAAVTLTALGNR